tara:strand:- start:817 stop:1644 length:828 start_codon:yes stop_codon:yes gene_type:complete
LKINFLYILFIVFLSCKNNLVNDDSHYDIINEEDVNWFYNVDNQQLLIQIDTSNISSPINSLKIKLAPFHNDFYEVFDDGSENDLIPNNNIYSFAIDSLPSNQSYTLYLELENTNSEIKEYQYSIKFNSPSIISDSVFPYVPSQHVLDQNDITFLDLVLAINDDDGSSDIDYVRYYIKKINFFNGSLSSQGNCEYEYVQQDEYIWDPTWVMNYTSTNSENQLLYVVQIPMNPIQSQTDCGGFGEVQFKFEVKDKKGFYDILEIDDIVQICPGVCE